LRVIPTMPAAWKPRVTPGYRRCRSYPYNACKAQGHTSSNAEFGPTWLHNLRYQPTPNNIITQISKHKQHQDDLAKIKIGVGVCVALHARIGTVVEPIIARQHLITLHRTRRRARSQARRHPGCRRRSQPRRCARRRPPAVPLRLPPPAVPLRVPSHVP
jgi:hypothetical protein